MNEISKPQNFATSCDTIVLVDIKKWNEENVIMLIKLFMIFGFPQWRELGAYFKLTMCI